MSKLDLKFCRESDNKGTVEFDIEVPDGIYPVTTCVVDSARFLQGVKVFPCGSGDDHRLTEAQEKAITMVFAIELDMLHLLHCDRCSESLVNCGEFYEEPDGDILCSSCTAQMTAHDALLYMGCVVH